MKQLSLWWQERIQQQSLGAETVAAIEKFEKFELDLIKQLLMQYHVNVNKTRELIIYIDEIKLRDNISVADLIKAIVKNISAEKQKDQQFEEIRKELRRWRFPAIVRKEEAWQSAVKKLNLPNSVAVFPPKDFEGDEVFVKFENQEMQEKIASLKKTKEWQALEKLL